MTDERHRAAENGRITWAGSLHVKSVLCLTWSGIWVLWLIVFCDWYSPYELKNLQTWSIKNMLHIANTEPLILSEGTQRFLIFEVHHHESHVRTLYLCK